MSEEVEDTKVDASPELLQAYGELFAQLLESERFKELMALHFTIHKHVDDEAKTITFQVIENAPEVMAAKVKQAVAAQERAKAPDIAVVSPETAKRLLKGKRH